MYYTIAFYIIIALISTQKGSKSKEKILKWICITIAIYTSLRYNYPSDYVAYHRVFDNYADPNYTYDPSIDHFEYGWYLINKLFAPFGYYTFVTFCDCMLAYAIYLLFRQFVPKHLIPLAALGVVAMGGFEVLLSAQRQLLCTSIFIIAYVKLIYGQIYSIKDLLKPKVIVYFFVIYLCHFFHNSSLFLIVIPVLYILPKNSKLVLLGLSAVAFILLFYASQFLPDWFEAASEQYGYYDYLNFTGKYSGSLTLLQAMMYAFQVWFIVKIYLKYEYTKDEQCTFLISILAILIVLAGYSLGQIVRLSHYLYMFTFITICIVSSKMGNTLSNKIYIYVNYVWVVWNLLKIFGIQRGTYYEYKLVLPYLF